METSFTTQIVYAFLGGIIPALIWLLFWLREDLHPEPKRLLTKAFAAGAIVIPLALFAEAVLYCINALAFLFPEEARICGTLHPALRAILPISGLLIIIGFAAVEEVVKYLGAKKFVLKGKDFDEPVDAMIYLITVALGFAAFENFFFLIPAFGSTLFEGFVVTNLRFLGATLLHAVSSGVVGYAIALSFYHPEKRKHYVITGLLFATALHTLFNIIVIDNGVEQIGFSQALGVLIITSLFLIFAFDRAKKIKRAARFKQTPLPYK
jgi:protease PrsW